MKAQLSSKDIIKISAYLDGELSERERLHFEKRLQSEDSLKFALQDLRQTKQLLQKLSYKKSPYNFTISQSMAESLANPFRQLIRVFSYTSAASFLLAVVLLFFNFTPNLVRMSASAPMAYDTVSITQEKAAEEAQEPEIILWNGPQVLGKGGGGEEPMPQMAAPAQEMGQEAVMAVQPTLTANSLEDNEEAAVFEAETIEEESVMAEEGVPDSEVLEESAEAVEMDSAQDETAAAQAEEPVQSREAEPTTADIQSAAQPTAESFNPILGIPSAEKEEDQTPVGLAPLDSEQSSKEINWFLIAEISLGIIAVITALLAIWLRKKP